MSKYSEEFKEQVVRKMMAPNAMSVAQVSRDTGVSEQALYNWRNRLRTPGTPKKRGIKEKEFSFYLD
jgi:transposase-like protein